MHAMTDQIQIGNGIGLPILHLGTTQLVLSKPSLYFQLHIVLHVPHSKKSHLC